MARHTSRLRIALPLLFGLATIMAACDLPGGLASLNVVPSMQLSPSFGGSMHTTSPVIVAPSGPTANAEHAEAVAAQSALAIAPAEQPTEAVAPSADAITASEPIAAPISEPIAPVAEAIPVFDPRAALLATNSFRMKMPFQTQKDGTRYEGANCGPAALGMVLGAFGMAHDDMELRILTHAYQGTGLGGGTALQFMAQVGEDFGLQPIGLYDDGDNFHRWTVDDVRAQLELGHPVVPLVKYRLLPDHTDSTYRWDHYVVIYGVDGDRFLYHDPAYGTATLGGAHWMTAAQLDAVLAPTLVKRQAVAFAPGDLAPLAVSAL